MSDKQLITFNNELPSKEVLQTQAKSLTGSLISKASDKETRDFIKQVFNFEYEEFLLNGCKFDESVLSKLSSLDKIEKSDVYTLIMYCADSRDFTTLEQFYQDNLEMYASKKDREFIAQNFETLKTELGKGKSFWQSLHGDISTPGTMENYFMTHPERTLHFFKDLWDFSNINPEETVGLGCNASAKQAFYTMYNIPENTEETEANIIGLKQILDTSVQSITQHSSQNLATDLNL